MQSRREEGTRVIAGGTWLPAHAAFSGDGHVGDAILVPGSVHGVEACFLDPTSRILEEVCHCVGTHTPEAVDLPTLRRSYQN